MSMTGIPAKSTFLFRARPWLDPKTLVEMKPVQFPSRDGLAIHGYLTLPKGVPAENLPAVMVVHGGPWLRDEWGYDGECQFLANRGYAVLQVNYRGSTGYGKKFVNAGDKEWGGKMLDDMVDGADWLIKQKIADPKRFGIYGGSYGGYATLAALAFQPKVFRLRRRLRRRVQLTHLYEHHAGLLGNVARRSLQAGGQSQNRSGVSAVPLSGLLRG